MFRIEALTDLIQRSRDIWPPQPSPTERDWWTIYTSADVVDLNVYEATSRHFFLYLLRHVPTDTDDSVPMSPLQGRTTSRAARGSGFTRAASLVLLRCRGGEQNVRRGPAGRRGFLALGAGRRTSGECVTRHVTSLRLKAVTRAAT